MKLIAIGTQLKKQKRNIHNWSLQPFNQDYGLLIPLMLCALLFQVSGGIYSLTSRKRNTCYRSRYVASTMEEIFNGVKNEAKHITSLTTNLKIIKFPEFAESTIALETINVQVLRMVLNVEASSDGSIVEPYLTN